MDSNEKYSSASLPVRRQNRGFVSRESEDTKRVLPILGIDWGAENESRVVSRISLALVTGW
jgi:hypothetical protein